MHADQHLRSGLSRHIVNMNLFTLAYSRTGLTYYILTNVVYCLLTATCGLIPILDLCFTIFKRDTLTFYRKHKVMNLVYF